LVELQKIDEAIGGGEDDAEVGSSVGNPLGEFEDIEIGDKGKGVKERHTKHPKRTFL
jgi:hypothetical protein